MADKNSPPASKQTLQSIFGGQHDIFGTKPAGRKSPSILLWNVQFSRVWQRSPCEHWPSSVQSSACAFSCESLFHFAFSFFLYIVAVKGSIMCHPVTTSLCNSVVTIFFLKWGFIGTILETIHFHYYRCLNSLSCPTKPASQSELRNPPMTSALVSGLFSSGV